MPIATVSGIRRMAGMCGAAFPDELERSSQRVDGDDDATYALGVAGPRMQCGELLERGVAGHPLLHAEPLAGDARDLREPLRLSASRDRTQDGLACASRCCSRGAAPASRTSSNTSTRDCRAEVVVRDRLEEEGLRPRARAKRAASRRSRCRAGTTRTSRPSTTRSTPRSRRSSRTWSPARLPLALRAARTLRRPRAQRAPGADPGLLRQGLLRPPRARGGARRRA